MKSIVTLLFAVSLLITLGMASCKKKKEVLNKLQGRLMDSCGGAPVANANMEFWQNHIDRSGLFTEDVEAVKLVLFQTDANGFFEIEMPNMYYSGKSSRNASVRVSLPTSVVTVASGNFELDQTPSTLNIGDVYVDGIRRPSVFSFDNFGKFAVGDKVVATVFDISVGVEYEDTVICTVATERLFLTKRAFYRTKKVEKGVPAADYKHEGLVSLNWNYKSKTDFFKNYFVEASSCSSFPDTLVFVPQ
jgi:hypothetical protein